MRFLILILAIILITGCAAMTTMVEWNDSVKDDGAPRARLNDPYRVDVNGNPAPYTAPGNEVHELMEVSGTR